MKHAGLPCRYYGFSAAEIHTKLQHRPNPVIQMSVSSRLEERRSELPDHIRRRNFLFFNQCLRIQSTHGGYKKVSGDLTVIPAAGFFIKLFSQCRPKHRLNFFNWQWWAKQIPLDLITFKQSQ